VPRVVRLHRVRRGRQHVDEVVVQHPVLLGGEGEVFDTRGDLVRAAEVRDVHGVRQEVVRLVANALRRVLRGMRRELPTDQLQVVRVGAVGVGYPAVPPDKSRALADRRGEPREGQMRDLRHGHALHDQIGARHQRPVGVGLVGVLDLDIEPVLLEERHEEIRRADGIMPVPTTTNDECGAGCHKRFLRCGVK